MTFSEMHNSYLDSLSGARELEEVELVLYVKIHTTTNELFEEEEMLAEDAVDRNERLAADGSPYRWLPYGSREEEVAA